MDDQLFAKNYSNDDDSEFKLEHENEGKFSFSCDTTNVFSFEDSQSGLQNPLPFKSPSFFEYYRRPIIIIVSSVLAICGLLWIVSQRNFTVEATGSAEAIGKLRVDAPVVCDGVIIGEVVKVITVDSNGGRVRLNIDRRMIPRNDAIFKLEETATGVRIIVEGGSTYVPLMANGTTVALRETSGTGLNFVRDFVRRGPLQNVRRFPWVTIIFIIAVVALIVVFRKTLLIVALLIVVIVIAITIFRSPALSESFHNFIAHIGEIF